MAVRAATAGVLVAAAVWAAAAGAAQPTIAGAWRFETGVFDQDCRITGEMALRPTGDGAYACTFFANQRCPAGEVNIVARQTCKATVVGTNVVMTATIVDVKPQTSYAPDNWVLTIVNPNQMKGELRSADTATVVFYRIEAAIS
jgi:hypothetical protein